MKAVIIIHFLMVDGTDSSIGTDGVRALSLSLEYNTSLTTLSLQSLAIIDKLFEHENENY